MTVDKATGESVSQTDHRRALEQIRDAAISVAGTAAKIAEAANEVLDKGGTLNVQPQLAFITGAHARMLKDQGVVEHLQKRGTSQKRRTPPR